MFWVKYAEHALMVLAPVADACRCGSNQETTHRSGLLMQRQMRDYVRDNEKYNNAKQKTIANRQVDSNDGDASDVISGASSFHSRCMQARPCRTE